MYMNWYFLHGLKNTYLENITWSTLISLFKANEFNEKKEKALKQIDELALDRSVEAKDKQEVLYQEILVN